MENKKEQNNNYWNIDFWEFLGYPPASCNSAIRTEINSSMIDFSQLAEESTVKIVTNKLEDIPDTFEKLEKVRELILTKDIFTSGTSLTVLPKSISKVKSLNSLVLHGHSFAVFPQQICYMESLRELNLLNCKVKSIPPEFLQLVNLMKVILDNNSIKKLENIPTNLQYLSLVNNQIESMSGIKGCQKLKVLDLSENNIKVIPPDVLQNLKELEKFELRENFISELPISIKLLEKLYFLHLNKNLLKEIPNELFSLRKLKFLDVSNNQITSLTKNICDLTQFDKMTFVCVENPLHTPPIEVTTQGLGVIKSYYEELGKQPAIHNKRAKLMILGESKSGKTSLAKSIVYGCEQKEDEKEVTIGIDFFHWKAQPLKNNGLEILLVDCAGQKKYMLTHQLFLSSGMLFAVVINLHSYTETLQHFNESIGSWLDLIIARVPNATILLVPTHIDLFNNKLELAISKCRHILQSTSKHFLDMEELQKKKNFTSLAKPNLPCRFVIGNETYSICDNMHQINMVSVSNRNPLTGLTHLKDEIIRIANNQTLCPHTNHTVPSSWVDLEKFCLSEKQNCQVISVEELYAKTKLFDNKKCMVNALQYIDSVGPILYFNAGLHDIVFLEPKWLIKLMKMIFRHDLEISLVFKDKYKEHYFKLYEEPYFESLFENHKKKLVFDAKLSKKLLRCIWCEEVDDLTFEYIVGILQSFNLLYSLDDETLLAPWYFKETAPSFISNIIAKEKTQKTIKILLETNTVCPEGFFPRFIVQVYMLDLFTICSPWTHGFVGKNEHGCIICEYKTTTHSSRVYIIGCAKEDSIYHLWNTIIKILQTLQKFMENWKGICHRTFSMCPYTSDTNPCNLHPLDLANLLQPCQRKINFICQCQFYDIDKELMLPPRASLHKCGILDDSIEYHDMEELVNEELCARISKYLVKHKCDVVRNILDVDLNDLLNFNKELLENECERTICILKIWARSRKNPSRQLLYDTLWKLNPFPSDALDYLLFKKNF